MVGNSILGRVYEIDVDIVEPQWPPATVMITSALHGRSRHGGITGTGLCHSAFGRFTPATGDVLRQPALSWIAAVCSRMP